jgi:hypothetical protein
MDPRDALWALLGICSGFWLMMIFTIGEIRLLIVLSLPGPHPEPTLLRISSKKLSNDHFSDCSPKPASNSQARIMSICTVEIYGKGAFEMDFLLALEA